MLRYDGTGRVCRGHLDVLVSSSLSPWRHELQVFQRMRRLCVRRLEADVRQEAAGAHIEAKRGRGRLRDGGASKEIMLFFSVKGSRGRRVQSVYTLGEF